MASPGYLGSAGRLPRVQSHVCRLGLSIHHSWLREYCIETKYIKPCYILFILAPYNIISKKNVCGFMDKI
jgi:hypothetical protein